MPHDCRLGFPPALLALAPEPRKQHRTPPRQSSPGIGTSMADCEFAIRDWSHVGTHLYRLEAAPSTKPAEAAKPQAVEPKYVGGGFFVGQRVMACRGLAVIIEAPIVLPRQVWYRYENGSVNHDNPEHLKPAEAAAPQADADGWIAYQGALGKTCPVPLGSILEIEWASGRVWECGAGCVVGWDRPGSIKRYRVVTQ